MLELLKGEDILTVCIFPGTFNPIHKGHLKMAEFALDKYNFDKIIFIPAYLPPHKEIDKELAQHRFEMVKLAIANNPKFEISDIEYQSEGKSYSLITVQKIIEQYNIKDRLNFIIGTDAFCQRLNRFCLSKTGGPFQKGMTGSQKSDKHFFNQVFLTDNDFFQMFL